MGWNYPEISLEDLVSLIKAFVDMLILASGYQSSGRRAIWDSDSIEKAVRWGIFFEDVLKRLCNSAECGNSVAELDEALDHLYSSSLIPHGLGNLSSERLLKAKEMMLELLLKTDPIEEVQFTALAMAAIRADINNLKVHNNGLKMYIDGLMLQIESLTLNLKKGSDDYSASLFDSRNFDVYSKVGSTIPLADGFDVETSESVGPSISCNIIQELLRRQSCFTCLSSVEKAKCVLSKTLTRMNSLRILEEKCLRNPSKNEVTEIFFCDQWRSRCIAYLLDKKTMRLLSGASMILSAPKVQWTRVFERLQASSDVHSSSLLEIMEMLLFAFISRRWNFLVEHFMSHANNLVPVAEQLYDIQKLLQERSRCQGSDKEATTLKEIDVLEYFTQLFEIHPQKLWGIHPVLAAAALPSWSSVFQIYLSKMERLLVGSSSFRLCDCNEAQKEHQDCDVADRVRCLYAFHIEGPT